VRRRTIKTSPGSLVHRSRLSENFERPPALMSMIEPAEQIDYTASIVSTDDTRHPFAVIVTARGEEVARKRVRTVEEAELSYNYSTLHLS